MNRARVVIAAHLPLVPLFVSQIVVCSVGNRVASTSLFLRSRQRFVIRILFVLDGLRATQARHE